MNYIRIHDSIINRALSRNLHPESYSENHHILPKCEGGTPDSPTVKLTLKEHTLIHKLRYKITGVIGNLIAYNLMQTTSDRKLNSKPAAKYSHTVMKQRDIINYTEKQRTAGIKGGQSAYKNNKGWFAHTEQEMAESRLRGTMTSVRNKLGMFSDAFIEKHRKTLMKKVQVENRIFNSMSEAARFYNISNGTVTYRVNSVNFTEWNFINVGENNE